MKLKLFLTIGTLLIILNSCGFKDNYKQISHKEFLKTHQFSIGQTTLLLNDSTRKRPLKTEIWYPTKDTTKFNVTTEYPFKLPPTSKNAKIISGKFPLILFSHGTGGNRISLMWLAGELASNGYIAAAVDHWGNTLDNKIPENFVKIWDRPIDISFVLNEIIHHSNFRSNIDTNKIGMVGFSLGGYTAIALAGGNINYSLLKKFSKTEEGKKEFNVPELGNVSKLITLDVIDKGNKDFRNLKDDRISAFVAMAPAIGQGFNKESQFKNVNSSILIIGTENDDRAPIKTNAKHYHNLIKDSKYIELEGNVGHYIFMNEAKNGLRRAAPLIFKDKKGVNRNSVHKQISKIIIKYFDQKLKRESH